MTTVKYFEKQSTEKEIYAAMHPLVAEWFRNKFGSFTEAQKYFVLSLVIFLAFFVYFQFFKDSN